MSFKLRTTEEAFSALEHLTNNDYRMYDPMHQRHFYDHPIDVYECAVREAEGEYARLLEHCEHQRDALRRWDRAWLEDQFLRKHALMPVDDEKEKSMESIDRLREWLDHGYSYGTGEKMFEKVYRPWFGWRSTLEPMLDAIEREVEEMWHALTIDAKPMTDENMAEHGWVRLPVDADGVPIRVGDWITGDWDAKAKVVAITSEDVYWWEPDGCHWCHAYEVRHHHAPTVEDVLEQFLTAYDDADEGLLGITTKDVISEFAAKLRLAEGSE